MRQNFPAPFSRPSERPRLKPEDITTFNGKDVEFFMGSCTSHASLYREYKVVVVIPCALKGLAKDWFLSNPPYKRDNMRDRVGWSYLLGDEVGRDRQGRREKAEARFFNPDKETVE